ncbi:YitT family protein [Streptococcus parasanguinis]|uniref:YitT family protein n=1 Tax=Streptococcus parasanguinis TaxID=1318 RepID=UPI0003D5AAEB|nr:YitT family protein [Streptococcus parasanguinis]ETJ04652.1 MAG: YitT family protein [Streptococcus parasanguinis DORA_23_24]MDB8627808.1 YitT family protein [Streptococcus parasanguinis]
MFKFKDILAIIFGAGIFSFGIYFLVIPFHFYEGGATGITLITYYLFKIPVSIMNLLINIPLFVLAWKLLGKKSLYLSLLGTFSVSAWMAIFEAMPLSHRYHHFIFDAFKGDILLACIASGVVLGLGLGIIFNAGGTTGGTDILARIFNKYTSLSMGKLMLIVDAIVLTTVVVVFQDVRTAMYTLFFILIDTLVIDLIGEGGFAGKGFLIVTSKPEEIAQKVSDDLGRGITFIRGMGYYSRKDLDIVYCVVSRNEMKQMKDIINQIDPFAFITISEAHEILGEGFTLDKEKQPITR